jgi:hypothetical protein
LAGEIFTEALDHLLYSVQTGKTGFEKAFGVPLFDWLASHPAEASMFSETMVGLHGTEPPAVAAAYDFSEFGTERAAVPDYPRQLSSRDEPQ